MGTYPADAVSDPAPPCVDKLAEVAGRDRVIATKLRTEAERLLKMAEALEINSTIATHAAAELLTDDDD